MFIDLVIPCFVCLFLFIHMTDTLLFCSIILFVCFFYYLLEIKQMYCFFQKFRATLWPKEEYGQFYDADAFIVLNVSG